MNGSGDMTSQPAPRVADRVAEDWRTVRCENERCRHIIFRYAREERLSGGVAVEVRCSCNTMNKIRLRVINKD